MVRYGLAILMGLQCPSGFAQQASSSSVLDLKGPQQTAEYIFRNSARDNLISVQLFGSVARPGLYYVPDDTDLLKLLTLAGGVNNVGELQEVFVHKSEPKSWLSYDRNFLKQVSGTAYKVDVDGFLKKSSAFKPLKMAHQDFIYVPRREPFISEDAYRAVTVASVVLSAILTGFLIDQYRRDN